MWVLLPKSTKLKEENIPKKKREWNEERKGSRTGVKAQVGCEATCYPFIKRFSNVVWHLRGQCVYHSRTTSTSTSTSPTPTRNTLSQSLSLPARRLFLSHTNTPASLVKVRDRERGRKSANQPQLALTDATNAKLFPLCVCLCAQCFVSVRVCKCACVSVFVSVYVRVCGFDIICAASWQMFATAALNWILTFLCLHMPNTMTERRAHTHTHTYTYMLASQTTYTHTNSATYPLPVTLLYFNRCLSHNAVVKLERVWVEHTPRLTHYKIQLPSFIRLSRSSLNHSWLYCTVARRSMQRKCHPPFNDRLLPLFPSVLRPAVAALSG